MVVSLAGEFVNHQNNHHLPLVLLPRKPSSHQTFIPLWFPGSSSHSLYPSQSVSRNPAPESEQKKNSPSSLSPEPSAFILSFFETTIASSSQLPFLPRNQHPELKKTLPQIPNPESKTFPSSLPIRRRKRELFPTTLKPASLCLPIPLTGHSGGWTCSTLPLVPIAVRPKVTAREEVEDSRDHSNLLRQVRRKHPGGVGDTQEALKPPKRRWRHPVRHHHCSVGG